MVIRSADDIRVAIVAPQGGSIEAHASSIARQTAGTDFNLYLLEGTRLAGNAKRFIDQSSV